jgi:hypothetical protein
VAVVNGRDPAALDETVTVPGHPECSTQEATGHGWVFVDDALAATPAP